MKSATENPRVIDDYLSREVEAGRVIGPMGHQLTHAVHINRFGVVPKNHQPCKWWLIVDLSHPDGFSVNDGIEPELCSLRYTSVDEAVQAILSLGQGAQMAKVDIESAYRIIPVYPTDRLLLGMQWKEKTYVDTALPFGLRSAPKIFNAVADALQWIFQCQGVKGIHYLDDFLLFGSPDSDECRQALEKILETCARLGVPLALHKTKGPSTIIIFLGIELDMKAMTLRLPEEKLIRLKREILRWQGRRSCTKRELLSLIGLLQHACCVVRPGRSFLRRMIALTKATKELHHRIRLNRGFRSDLQWWACFLPDWNGVSMMSRYTRAGYGATVTSDASGSWGCGAYSSSGEWFQFEWPAVWLDRHITIKELLPIVLGVAIWGSQWTGLSVRCRCDNAAVVAIINSGTSKDERAMHLMRCLFFFLAKFRVTLVGEHIPGKHNQAADALSRNDHLSFLSQVPTASPQPTRIRQELLQALVFQQPDWTSQAWTSLLQIIS